MTATKIRQSEFAEKHNLRPNEVADLRNSHLTAGEFWSEGRAIYWSPEAAARVEGLIRLPTLEEIGGKKIETDFGTVLLVPNFIGGAESFSIDEVAEPDPTYEEFQAAAEKAFAESAPDFTPTENTAEDGLLQVRVTKRARNYRFVYANLDGERIAVMVPKNTRKSLIGKTVKVARAKGADDVVTYTLIP